MAMHPILLLGSTGYIGQAFSAEIRRRDWAFRPLSRAEVDYTRHDRLLEFLRRERPSFVVSAAGYTGRPNVDACELARAETLAGNVLFPLTLAHACAVEGIPWGHVSSGCIYSGAKVRSGTGFRVEKDLTTPEMREMWARHPGALLGFSEEDPPNFSFRRGPCSFYSGSKALAEEALTPLGGGYLWRLRIPFNEEDHPKNYLSKLLTYPKVYDNVNSISHLDDAVKVCLDLWRLRAPFGAYNVVNRGAVSTREVVDLIREHLRPEREFEFWASDEEFYRLGARTPRSNCILEVGKLERAGVMMRGVREAMVESLRGWRPAA